MKYLALMFVQISICAFSLDVFALNEESNITNPFDKDRSLDFLVARDDGLNKYSVLDISAKGILLSSKKSWVILEDPNGKIYPLSNGEKFGKENLLIKEILIDQIVVEISDENISNEVMQMVTKIKKEKGAYVLMVHK